MNWLITIALALLGITANACTCPFVPLNTESARDAKQVFVFRLVDAALQREGSEQEVTTIVVGTIEVVADLRGTTNAKRIIYSTLWCCGTRLDVGKYYAAFISDNSEQFDAHSGNLLELGGYYAPGSNAGTKLRAVVAGQETLEKAFSEEKRDRTEQIPRPPPPCPRVTKHAG